MKQKTLLEILEEVKNQKEHRLDYSLLNSGAAPEKRAAFDLGLVEELGRIVKGLRRHFRARRALSPNASWDDIRLKEAELYDEEEERERTLAIRENYYRHIASGLLDMSEAVTWRYDVFSGAELDPWSEEKIYNLFSSGKRTLLMYARWLKAADESSFIDKWIETIEPIELNKIGSVENWLKAVGNLPVY
ncbi:hypothetical protein IKE99_01550 [Candidatus Saccharibacteria bacterium]|nr:hypothetical protein [Candidatus Saccharibacteria bacterium]